MRNILSAMHALILVGSVAVSCGPFIPSAKAQDIGAWNEGEAHPSYLPDAFVAQHAAYAGFAAAGFAWEFKERLSIGLLYGYTPANYGGRDIHSWSGKSLYSIAPVTFGRKTKLQSYLGLGFVYSAQPGLFVRLPKQYPAGYYEPTALYALAIGGVELRIGPQWSIGAEYALLNTEFVYWKNSGKLVPSEIGSAGINLRRSLH